MVKGRQITLEFVYKYQCFCISCSRGEWLERYLEGIAQSQVKWVKMRCGETCLHTQILDDDIEI